MKKTLRHGAMTLLLLGAILRFPPPARALLDGNPVLTQGDIQTMLKAVLGLQQLTTDQINLVDFYPSPGAGDKAGQDHGDGKIDLFDIVAATQKLLNPIIPIDPTFVNVQRYVFNNSCAFSSCHGTEGRRGNMLLTEGQAYQQLVNVVCSTDGDSPAARYRVKPGDPANSMLYVKLTHPSLNDGALMPYGTETSLDPSKVELIRRWILKGAPNDGDPNAPDPSQTADNKKLTVDPNLDANGDVRLAPPPPGEGVQMEIPPFDVPPGKEIQRNYYFKLPVDQDVDISKVEFNFNPGCHHLNIFKSDTDDLPDGYYDETFQAVAWEKWFLVVDSQNHTLGWQLPPGVVIHLKAHQQLDLQIHYVNFTDQRTSNNRGKALVNWWFAKPGTVKYHMGALFAQNRTIYLPPHQFSSFSKVVTFPQDVTVLAMTGHFHSRGKQFTVYDWDGQKTGEMVYQSVAWGDPQFQIFSEPFDVKAGQGFSYACDYYNDTDLPITFGAHVETEEHANLFVFFYPGLPDDKALYEF